MSTSAERMSQKRERDKLAEMDEGKPWAGLTGGGRDQAILSHYGYNTSEKRTQAERQTAADRMGSVTSEVGYGTADAMAAQAHRALAAFLDRKGTLAERQERARRYQDFLAAG